MRKCNGHATQPHLLVTRHQVVEAARHRCEDAVPAGARGWHGRAPVCPVAPPRPVVREIRQRPPGQVVGAGALCGYMAHLGPGECERAGGWNAYLSVAPRNSTTSWTHCHPIQLSPIYQAVCQSRSITRHTAGQARTYGRPLTAPPRGRPAAACTRHARPDSSHGVRRLGCMVRGFTTWPYLVVVGGRHKATPRQLVLDQRCATQQHSGSRQTLMSRRHQQVV